MPVGLSSQRPFHHRQAVSRRGARRLRGPHGRVPDAVAAARHPHGHGARGHGVPLRLHAAERPGRLRAAVLPRPGALRLPCTPGDAVGQGGPRGRVPPLRAGLPCQQREPRYRPHGVLPRAERTSERHDHRGGRAGGQPLVPRARGLPRQRQPHLVAPGHHAHQPRSLRRGEHLHRHRHARRRYPRPPVLYAPLGTLRRQPCMGRGLCRRRVEVPRCLRARPAARHGLVLRAQHALHDGTHQGLRPLQGRRGGGAPHRPLQRAQPAQPLRPHAPRHSHCTRRRRQAAGGRTGEVQALQLRRVLHPCHGGSRRRGACQPHHRTRRPARLGYRRRLLRLRQDRRAPGQHLDPGLE